jgi:hypothetical protein
MKRHIKQIKGKFFRAYKNPRCTAGASIFLRNNGLLWRCAAAAASLKRGIPCPSTLENIHPEHFGTLRKGSDSFKWLPNWMLGLRLQNGIIGQTQDPFLYYFIY